MMAKKLNRKAQIKMAESIGILFVFFMLLVLVMVFYSRLQGSKILEQREEDFIKKSIEIALIVSYLPEVQCSRDNVLEDNCFDLYKIGALGKIMAEDEKVRLYYYDQFEFSEIKINRIYPGGENITLYDNPKEDWVGKSAIPIPITIYDPITRQHGFGVLEVATYR